MKIINLETWERTEVYNFFKTYDLPRYQITVDIDVTNLYKYAKTNHLSFYFSMMWIVMSELNKIDHFKYRIKDNDVIFFDQIHPSFTDMIDNSDRFKIVNTLYNKDIFKFAKDARDKSDQQKDQFINYDEEVRQDLVYVTVFPWYKYSQITNATQLDPKDAIPRVIWGKYKKNNDRLIMPLTIEVHHGFVDGYHVGLLINNIAQYIEKL